MARIEQRSGNSTLAREENGSHFSPKEPLNGERKKRIEWWRDAPEKVIDYLGGSAIDGTGNIYTFESGRRLIIGGQEEGKTIEVMDTCEIPWAHATVDRAFEALGIRNRPTRVLERGFGMGITATKIIQNLHPRGGTYTVIELNRGDAEYARREWRRKQLGGLTNMARGVRGATSDPNIVPNIVINIIEGDAYEETAKLAKTGEKFDIIFSDTYPLTEDDEQGMNDLRDLETLKKCLEPDGVFAFFAFFPGSTEDVAYKQANMIAVHFQSNNRSRVGINPPPDYKYLNHPITGPVRTLPVVICKNPIP